MKRKNLIICICIVVIVICSYIYIMYEIKESKIDITKYSVTNEKIPDEFDNFKIVQLSDFHSNGYKNTTDVIIESIKDINPNIIVMTGDMIGCQENNIEELEKLVNSLVYLYPMYYIDGNHEQLVELLDIKRYEAYIGWMKSLGITVLNNNYVEIKKNEVVINLYGINLPLDGATGLYATNLQIENNYVEKTLLTIDDEKFNILLAHTPLFIEQYSQWRANLVLSGHMHGGIIRIPFIDVGVLSPEHKLFPNYDCGEFNYEDTTMIVNRGIGTSSFELRIFNNPEVSVITLKK